jgi:hypothetical protein
MKNAGSLWAIGGMTALLFGQKKTALGLFARGAQQLEAHWREKHPDFRGDLSDRWNEAVKFYEATHQNQVNRYLHITGIPMIAAGAAGLLVCKPWRPAWFASAGAFTTGWVLNIVGHAAFEKKAPAFKDDPLSFIAGPVWDLQQLFGAARKSTDAATETPAATAPEGVTGVRAAANDVSIMN